MKLKRRGRFAALEGTIGKGPGAGNSQPLSRSPAGARRPGDQLARDGVSSAAARPPCATMRKPPSRESLPSCTGTIFALKATPTTCPSAPLQFRSNWELSTARATGIIQDLITQHNFSPEQLSAAGYAEFHPVASNATEEGRKLNRRIDIVVLRSGHIFGDSRRTGNRHAWNFKVSGAQRRSS